jgi:FKBP-type peptidyl-prolyl cis-trans isomerase FklB
MRMIIVLCAALFLAQGIAIAQSGVSLKTRKDSISYSIGMNLGQNFKQQSLDIDPAILAAGLKDMLAEKTLCTQEQAMSVLNSFQQEMMAKVQAERSESGEKNKAEGKKFLEENAKKEGVKVTESGLQYKVVKEGTGVMPKATDKVKTHYTGTLIGGKKFDSSVDRGEPAEFPVNGVIKGWTEALQKMKVGSKWTLYIPSELAYGENGAGPDIGPNAVLIFDIELLEIVKGDGK